MKGIRDTVKSIAADFYFYYQRKYPLEKQTVLFESYHGSILSGSPFSLLRTLHEQGSYHLIVASSRQALQKNKSLLASQGIHADVISRDSLRYLKMLATAEFLINNNCFPVFFIRRSGQSYLNTWHGTPLKTLGKRMKHGIRSMYNLQHDFLQTSHLLFPNEYTKRHMMEDYNLERLYTGKVLVSGYPRNDVFFDKNKEKSVRAQLGVTEKTVYLYLPTWRGTDSIQSAKKTNLAPILQMLDQTLSDNELCYVGLHPDMEEAFVSSSFSHIRALPDDIPAYDFYPAADVLITDYSSILFDFSISGKPVLLYSEDLEDYASTRGFYFDPAKLPFPLYQTINDLCVAIRTKSYHNAYHNDKSYYSAFLEKERADNAKQVLGWFLHHTDTSLAVTDYAENKARPLHVKIQREIISEKAAYDRFLLTGDTANTVFLIPLEYFTDEVNRWFYEEYNEKGILYEIYQPLRRNRREAERLLPGLILEGDHI